MTVTQAYAAVRASALHDIDTQDTDAQLLVKITQEYQRLRRWLCTFVPNLYETSATITVAAGASSIAKTGLTNFERLRRVERQQGSASGTYYPISIADTLNANQARTLCAYEQGAYILLAPTSSAPGTYRVTFVTGTGTVAAGTTLDVPDGLEDVIVERCAAWVRQRHDEDPSYHIRAADEILKEQRQLLRGRYGTHAVPGLNTTR